jgi:hypothetical protein
VREFSRKIYVYLNNIRIADETVGIRNGCVTKYNLPYVLLQPIHSNIELLDVPFSVGSCIPQSLLDHTANGTSNNSIFECIGCAIFCGVVYPPIVIRPQLGKDSLAATKTLLGASFTVRSMSCQGK